MKNESTNQTSTAHLNTEIGTAPHTSTLPHAGTAQDRLIDFLETTLAPLGYELVAIEVINQRQKLLRVFIDKLVGSTPGASGVSIEDCVTVTHALDLPLDSNPDVEAVFKGPYELEVSSPGINRPLRKNSDYTKFQTAIARIHTYRPLTIQEAAAEAYVQKNPKQKNYYGIIRGFEPTTHSVLFGALPEDGTLKGNKRVETLTPLKNETLVRIPVSLISKAHLEPANLEPISLEPDQKERK